MFGEEYRSLTKLLLMQFLNSPVTSFFLGPNIFLNTLFSNTVSLRSSLTVSDQDPNPYKTMGKIMVLYIFIFLDNQTKDSAPNDSKYSLTSLCS